MDAVFIALFFFFTVVGFATFYLQRGIGNMAEPMRQFGLFLLNKAPAGIVDLFNDDKGSGSKTWMNLGMIWLTFAAIGTFLALWHDYDATALDSLASIGWEYDDGSALATFVDVTLMTGLTSILIGGDLVLCGTGWSRPSCKRSKCKSDWIIVFSPHHFIDASTNNPWSCFRFNSTK